MAQAMQREHYFSAEEYLESEEYSERRHEYYDGRIITLIDDTNLHNHVLFNTGNLLRNQLKNKEYKIYTQSTRLEVNKGMYYAYPDLMLTGDADDRKDRRLKRHPVLIGEVLSKATEDYDRGFKLRNYRHIPSLKHYLLVASYEYRVECFTRTQAGLDAWVYQVFDQLSDVIELPELGMKISLAEIYDLINFSVFEEE